MAKPLRCVICCYDVDPDAIVRVLDAVAADTGRQLFGVIVNNRISSQWRALNGWEIIQGSNALMDFSAYAEGGGHIVEHVEPGEAVMFVNDSTFTKHTARRHLQELVKYAGRLGQIEVPCIAGKVDNYIDHCFLNPWSGINAYVSTFSFMLNAGGIRTLLDVYACVDSVMGDPRLDVGDESWGAGLSPQFREFLRTHLTMPGSPSAWYQSEKYRNDRAMLRTKSRCVYLEHRLSGEIGRSGVIVSLYPRQRDKARFWFADQVAKLRRKVGH